MKWNWREYRVAKGGIRLKMRIYRGKVVSLAVFLSVISPSMFKREFNLQEQIKERYTNTEITALVLGMTVSDLL